MSNLMRRYKVLVAAVSSVLVMSSCTLAILAFLSARGKNGGKGKEWRKVRVEPEMLQLVVAVIAIGATVMFAVATLGEILQRHRLAGFILYLMGLVGLACGTWVFSRLYSAYLRQQGVLKGASAARLLKNPYGLLAVSLALIGAQTIVFLLMIGLASFAGV